MKNLSIILSHLSSQPQFKFLKQQSCYSKFIQLLGVKYQKAIAFIYIKNNTLFIAVTHPGFKMELNYNKDLLKSLLTQLTTNNNECKTMQAEKIIIFHSKYYPVEKSKANTSTIPHYTELSSSNFDINSNDADIIKRFELIKEQIKCNQQ